MRITEEWVLKHRTAGGSWYAAQIALLGESWPPVKGWIQRSVGKEIDDDKAALFEEFAKRRPSKQEGRDVKRMVGLLPPLHPKSKRWAKVVHYPQPANLPEVAKPDFLRTFEWRRVRMLALRKYGSRCQCCGAGPEHGQVMHVDHIKPRKLFPELALDLNNLQILCEDCNHGKGNWDMTDWRKKDAPAL